jgi:CxxC motif-containing protein
MIKNITCIVCPIGCNIVVEAENGEITSITGNQCQRGIDYAKDEFFFSGRILTTTVKIDSAEEELLPVRSDRTIPKAKLFSCMEIIRNAVVSAPIRQGDVVVSNICDTGSNIVATETVNK